MLINLARTKACWWQAQGHFDGAFNRIVKDFGMIGFSMGAHFNQVSMSIITSELKLAIISSYNVMTTAGLFSLFLRH
jgi:hypothetical protein